MSETEDTRAAAENNEIQKNVEERDSGRSGSTDNLDGREDVSEEIVKKQPENNEKEESEQEKSVENRKTPIETEKKEPAQAATPSSSTRDAEASASVDEKAARGEESGTRVGAPGTADGCNEIAAVGEWNSLPVLVGRLRAALELSLATGSRRDGETPAAVPEDSGIDSEEDLRIRNSMEVALGCKEPELRKDLKFLEDLLLSDIETALSRLRETLERIDVPALAKHGGASDPSSKLHLLRLVSSLLSRLQLPEQPTSPEPTKPTIPAPIQPTITTPTVRKRRATRHTIGVSAEELARARKWLEEERNKATLGEVFLAGREQKETDVTSNGILNPVDARPEEVHDKCTKDAINQRQSLWDKNKETLENCSYRGIQQVEIADTGPSGEASMYQAQYRSNENYRDKENDAGRSVVEDNEEEKGRVSKLAAALRQRAELSAANGRFAGSNKFTAKKSKIKRANTIDIPSYLKLQAESLGRESTGCISLRRPIDVSDKTSLNSINVAVPSFQPKTENDRKFLALISKNNEAPASNPPPSFKTFGYAKPTTDLSSLTNEHWNSRFSNIKTTFDKPTVNEERESKPSPKVRANKRFPGASQPQQMLYGSLYERRISHGDANYDSPILKIDTTGGFRHAPSSPFRKIEKTGACVSPSKVPTAYHWSRNNDVPPPTNTLREKARMMFDRETQPRSSAKLKSETETHEKPSFPRPPWIDHERTEVKSNGTVTENGRLDYRSFCKQFAPFVGKGAASMDTKSHDEPRQRPYNQRRDPAPFDKRFEKHAGVVDGKISFKMIPDNRVNVHRYPVIKKEQPPREKLGVDGRNAFESPKNDQDRRYGETELPRTCFGDATLRGSSSVAVQTGINDEHRDEGRSFRVAPRVSKGPPLICSNAAVQTNDLDRSAMSTSETGKQWKTAYLDRERDSNRVADTIYHPEDARRFVLDHNQNYRTVTRDNDFSGPSVSVSPDPRGPIGDQSFGEPVPFQGIPSYQGQSEDSVNRDRRLGAEDRQRLDDRETPEYPSLLISTGLPNASRPMELGDTYAKSTSDWSVESSSFPEDQNIQNQDISPEIGVVTRYTCAIATVASSVDSPEPRSEEIAMDSRASSSPSPSQWSWSRSRPPTNETSTPEEEIRRHNMLQQSLVRRLQNETTSLNDQPSFHPPNVAQRSNIDPTTRSYDQPSLHPPNVPQRSNIDPSTRSYDQPSLQPPNVPQRSNFDPSTRGYHQPSLHPPSAPQHSNFDPSTRIYGQPSHHRSANFDQPSNFTDSIGSNRSAKFLSPVPRRKLEPPPASPSTGNVNRVIALREAYEQSPAGPTKPVEKERSPIPNGVTPNDSSDEYLVSCATKPTRSIVLSKSESWHQLALTTGYPRAPRVNVTTPGSPSSQGSSHHRHQHHSKPPKPKSPSSQKLRSKQFEASSMADSVKKMEDKIRRYFDSPGDSIETRDSSRNARPSRASGKGLVGLSRSCTMPGICDEKLRVVVPPPQMPLLNVNTADVDKVFDDLFEEATRTEGPRC